MQNYKNRKLNRLKEYDYSRDGLYFITICVKNREYLFGEIIKGKMKLSEIGEIARKCWQEIPAHFPNIILDKYIIMPNHIHGIIAIKNNDPVGNNNYCSNAMDDKIVGNNNYCSNAMDDKIVGNNNFCSNAMDDKIVGNNNFCSLQSQQSQPWQTKWARSLSSAVRGFKIGVTKCRREIVGNNNYCSLPIWQKSFYDHIIRNENSLNKIKEYIINNPLKWGYDRNNAENLWM